MTSQTAGTPSGDGPDESQDSTDAGVPGILSAGQQVLLDRGFRACHETARRVARRIAGASVADDIVQEALLRMIVQATRPTDPVGLPEDRAAFGKRLVGLVKRMAKSAVRANVAKDISHACWGEVHAPVSGRKLPARLLALDHDNVHGLANRLDGTEPQYLVRARPEHRGPVWPEADPDERLYQLAQCLTFAMMRLPPMQCILMMIRAQGLARTEIADAFQISVKTYAEHARRAHDHMRRTLMLHDFIEGWGAGERLSDWSDEFKESWLRWFWRHDEAARAGILSDEGERSA